MSSNRFNHGLDYLGKCRFDKAIKEFEEKNEYKNQDISYFYAVAKLGNVLNKIADDKKPLIDHNYRDLLLTSTVKKQESKLIPHTIKKTTEDLSAIIPLFELAKKTTKHKNIPGIENALLLIKKLLEINKLNDKQRSEAFYVELRKFQACYTTKWHICTELDSFEEDFFIKYFIPKPIQKLRSILDANKHDLLYLSIEQINALYVEHGKYHYTKNAEEIFQHLAESLLFFHKYMSKENKEKYTHLWKIYNGVIHIEKVIFIHKIYMDRNLQNLQSIINELNKNKLLDKSLPSLKEITHFNPGLNPIKHITQIISDSVADTKKMHYGDNKNILLTHLFNFALEELPKKQGTGKYLKEYLTHIKTTYISQNNNIDVAKIILYLNILTIFSEDTSQLEQSANLIKETLISMGDKHFSVLCEKILHYKISPIHFIAIMNFALQLSNDDLQDVLNLIDKYHNNFHLLEAEVNDILIKAFQLKYPERPLEEVINDFRTKCNDVEYPIEDNELKQLTERYLKIKEIGDYLLTKGRSALQAELKEFKRAPSLTNKNEQEELRLLAIIRLQIKANMHIYPYNIQMLNLLALINQPRRIAQIKTGEGKSTLIAMLAAYYGFMKYTVDIITTTDDLAIRDTKKFQSFYQSLGLTVGHNVNQKNSDVYKNDIVYGGVSDFEFAYLRGETQGEYHGRGNRPYDVVVVDEVDSMLIDMQHNQAILSRSDEEGYKPDVYQTIWNWIEDTEENEQTKENLQAKLQSVGVEINLDLATTWLKSARTAQVYSQNKEYIIDDSESKSKNDHLGPRIKIVDKRHTGQISQATSRWQGGLHQILEAKHNLKIQVESLTTGCISHIEHFNKYKILAGLTGTLGSRSSRDGLKLLYRVATYDSPPYKPSLKMEIPHIIAEDEKSQREAVRKIAQKTIQDKRPILILSEDIEESEKYKKYLSTEIKSTQVYNGVQGTSAEKIIG
ncbi:MAG: hypothetical protein JO131_07885, partial [Gammaproteobacteria bacterium]|nr:hypothetical protein [Gammaproteobacteria bacterium]